jgi:ribosomal protein L13E
MKAVITKQNGKQSLGRGFSPNELEQAGLNMQDAKKIGIPMDIKRKSVHEENVACIKAHAEKAKTKAATKPKTETTTAEKPKKKAKS